jgi:hypothetical protein
MKREAVQEERQKNKDKLDAQSPQSTGGNDMRDDQRDYSYQTMSPFEFEDSSLSLSEKQFIEKLIESENAFFPKPENPCETDCSMDDLALSADSQVKNLPLWAKSIPQFNELDLDDQVSLLRTSTFFRYVFSKAAFIII